MAFTDTVALDEGFGELDEETDEVEEELSAAIVAVTDCELPPVPVASETVITVLLDGMTVEEMERVKIEAVAESVSLAVIDHGEIDARGEALPVTRRTESVAV